MSEKFWAVWREEGGSPPYIRFPDKQSAIDEAGRLAQQNNTRYFVLEVIGEVVVVKVPVVYTEIK